VKDLIGDGGFDRRRIDNEREWRRRNWEEYDYTSLLGGRRPPPPPAAPQGIRSARRADLEESMRLGAASCQGRPNNLGSSNNSRDFTIATNGTESAGTEHDPAKARESR
jgi:hypothetical protein